MQGESAIELGSCTVTFADAEGGPGETHTITEARIDFDSPIKDVVEKFKSLKGYKRGDVMVIMAHRETGKSAFLAELMRRHEAEQLKRLHAEMERRMNGPHLIDGPVSKMSVVIFDEFSEIAPEQSEESVKPRNLPHGPQRIRKGKARRW